MPVLTDGHGNNLPARTVWEQSGPITNAPFESFLLSWIRAGKVQLRFAYNSVWLTYHLPWLGSSMIGVRDGYEPNLRTHWTMLKQALMQPPYSFTYDGTFRTWTATRNLVWRDDNQVWEPLVRASEAWINSLGLSFDENLRSEIQRARAAGNTREAGRLEEIQQRREAPAAEARRQREARAASDAAADATRAERARVAEARAAEARAAASDRQRLERQGRVQEARERAPPPPPQQQQQQPADEESEDDDAPRPGDYVRTFGVNPDRVFGDAIANQTMERQEKELNENMIREDQTSNAQRVPLRHKAMRPVRDLINKTLDAMYDRIQGAYHDEELHPVDDATWVQFQVKTKLEIIAGVKVTLRASTSPSRALAAQKAGYNDEPDAATGWSLLFARNSVERRAVNAGLVGAGYKAVAGGGQVQVRNDNTLNIALNKVWESLDPIRQAAVRAAPARQPPRADQLVVVRQERTLAERGDNSDNEDEDEDEDDEATETSEEDESESEDEGPRRRRSAVERAIDGEDSDEEEAVHTDESEASGSEDSESEAESSDEDGSYSEGSEEEASAESSESESEE